MARKKKEPEQSSEPILAREEMDGLLGKQLPGNPWHYFPEDKMVKMDANFMQKLHELRHFCDFPFKVTSGYRSPQYNAQVSKTGKSGPHTTGRAVDIAVSGAQVFKVLNLAAVYGFTGIGLSQKGNYATRFIHLDDLPAGPRQPRPHVWTY